MGITRDRFERTRIWHGNFAAVMTLLVLAFLPVQAKSQEFGERKLLQIISNIDSAIAKSVITSTMYRMHHKLLITDFGYPVASWRQLPRRQNKLLGIEPLSALSNNLRSIVFYAVCRKNNQALLKVFEINKLIAGGIFLEIEIEYLQRYSHQAGLNLDFRAVFREFNRHRSSDVRYAELKRKVIAAFQKQHAKDALRMISGFDTLCTIQE